MSEQKNWYAVQVEALNLEEPCNYDDLLSKLIGHFEMHPKQVATKLAPYVSHLRGKMGHFVLREGKLDPQAIELFAVTREGESRLAIINPSPLDNSFTIQPALQETGSDEQQLINGATGVLLRKTVVFSNEERFPFGDFNVIVRHNIADGSFTVHFCSADMQDKFYSFAFDQRGDLVDMVNFNNNYTLADRQAPELEQYKVLVMQALRDYVSTERHAVIIRITEVAAQVRYAVENSALFAKLRGAHQVYQAAAAQTGLTEKMRAAFAAHLKMRAAKDRTSNVLPSWEATRRRALWNHDLWRRARSRSNSESG